MRRPPLCRLTMLVLDAREHWVRNGPIPGPEQGPERWSRVESWKTWGCMHQSAFSPIDECLYQMSKALGESSNHGYGFISVIPMRRPPLCRLTMLVLDAREHWVRNGLIPGPEQGPERWSLVESWKTWGCMHQSAFSPIDECLYQMSKALVESSNQSFYFLSLRIARCILGIVLAFGCLSLPLSLVGGL
jgi:hypothetical protein